MRKSILFLLLLTHLACFSQVKKEKNIYNTKINKPISVTVNGGATTIIEANNIKIKDNFQVIKYIDTVRFSKQDLPFELRPKSGVWYQPFSAYPLDEADAIKGALIPNFIGMSGMIQQASNVQIFIVNGKEKQCVVWTTPGRQSTPSNGSIFNCKKKPSVLIFGDLSNKDNYFYIKL